MLQQAMELVLFGLVMTPIAFSLLRDVVAALASVLVPGAMPGLAGLFVQPEPPEKDPYDIAPFFVVTEGADVVLDGQGRLEASAAG